MPNRAFLPTLEMRLFQLAKMQKNTRFQCLLFENFSDPHTGRDYGAPPQPPPLRGSGASRLPSKARLALDLPSLHRQKAGEMTSCTLDCLGPGKQRVRKNVASTVVCDIA